MKDFAIIIVNFNSSKDTLELLQSLEKYDPSIFDIYIVDNNSKKEEYEKLKYINSNNTFILKSSKNLGFAGANNLAITEILQVDYRFIFLLNPDTLIEDLDFFQKIKLELMDSKADIIGPLITYYPEKEKIYFAGGYVSKFTGFTKMKYKGQNVNKFKDFDYKKCDFITGCAMVIKKEVFHKIGLLSEEYFLYFEESDFCMRAQKSKLNVIFTPKTQIYHKVSSSIRYLSETYLFYMVRNMKVFGKKYVKREFLPFFYLFYYFYWVPGYILLSILKNKNFTGLRSILKALR